MQIVLKEEGAPTVIALDGHPLIGTGIFWNLHGV